MWDNKHIQVSDWLNQKSRGKVSYIERITTGIKKREKQRKIMTNLLAGNK